MNHFSILNTVGYFEKKSFLFIFFMCDYCAFSAFFSPGKWRCRKVFHDHDDDEDDDDNDDDDNDDDENDDKEDKKVKKKKKN